MNTLLKRRHSRRTASGRGGARLLGSRAGRHSAYWPPAAAVAILMLAAAVVTPSAAPLMPAALVAIVLLTAAVVVQHRPRRQLPGISAGLKLGAMFLCTEVAVGQATGRLAEMPELLGLAVALVAVVAVIHLPDSEWLAPNPRRKTCNRPTRPHARPPRIGMRCARRHDRAGRDGPVRRSRFRTDS